MSVLAVAREFTLPVCIPAAQKIQAEFAGLTALLNCYIREFALPAQTLYLNPAKPIPLSLTSRMIGGEVLVLKLGQTGATQLAIRAKRWSLLGRGDFTGAIYLKQFGRAWRTISAFSAIALLIEEMANQTSQHSLTELLEQIKNSIQVTRLFLSHQPQEKGQPSYLHSEESLLWGHPMHPSPKSRQGVNQAALLACSPEVSARFPLYWFSIAPNLLNLSGEPKVLKVFTILKGAHCYPCHPWEVDHIVSSPLFQRAQAAGLIKPIGLSGPLFAATSSVRTLYRADLPYYLKCSIHVRLTNCIRKNAWYELESAVALNTLLAPVFAKLEADSPGFYIMREPAATSLDFSAIATDNEAEAVRHLQECFGILFRENFSGEEPWLAAALFALDSEDTSPLSAIVQCMSQQGAFSIEQASILWFSRYLDILLPGILGAFFNEGIIFEPHLQNILVTLEDNLPVTVRVRDLEGTKLTTEKWTKAALKTMSARARQSVWYNRDQGFCRVAYCLFVNHLSEVMFRLAVGNRSLEQRLWDVLATRLAQWQAEPEIAHLLAGGPLPSKNNLKTRLLKHADKHADYTLLNHPMRSHH